MHEFKIICCFSCWYFIIILILFGLVRQNKLWKEARNLNQLSEHNFNVTSLCKSSFSSEINPMFIIGI